jgi:hypothetical protein
MIRPSPCHHFRGCLVGVASIHEPYLPYRGAPGAPPVTAQPPVHSHQAMSLAAKHTNPSPWVHSCDPWAGCWPHSQICTADASGCIYGDADGAAPEAHVSWSPLGVELSRWGGGEGAVHAINPPCAYSLSSSGYSDATLTSSWMFSRPIHPHMIADAWYPLYGSIPCWHAASLASTIVCVPRQTVAWGAC